MSGTPTADRALVLRTLAMPGDLNPGGSIFGGWLLGQMDMAAGMAASAHCRRSVMTVAVNEVRFLRPLRPGEIVEGYATLRRVGRSSMVFQVQIDAGLPVNAETLPVCEATFTMVAVDAEGHPVAIVDTSD